VSLLARVYLLVLLAAAPGFLLEFYRDVENRAEGEQRLRADAVRLAQFANLELTSVFEGARLFLTAVAAHPAMRNGDTPACNEHLMLLAPAPKPFRRPFLVSPEGSVVCAADAESHARFAAAHPYFAKAVASGKFTVGELIFGRSGGDLTLPVALPLRDETGAVSAVAGMEIDAAALQERFQYRAWPPGGSISIVDRTGTIVVRWPGPELVGQKLSEHFRWMLTATQPGTATGIGPDGIERIAGFIPPGVNNEFLVSVAMSRTAAMAALDAELRRDLILLAVCAIAAFTVAALFGRQLIDRPLRTLGEAVERLRQGDLSARAGLPRQGSELSRLGAAFDGMADELERQRAALSRSEAFFRQFAEHLPEIIWVEDLAGGRLAYVNEAYERLWGRSREALLSGEADWMEGVHPDDRARLEAMLAKARAGSTETIEYRVLRPDGEVRWLHSTSFPIRDPDGGIIHLARVSRDVTRRREAEVQREEALHQREVLFQELNHRIKNNLQIIRSLLNLQAGSVEEAAAKEALAAASQRVTAVADLHALLHRKGVVGTVDLAGYVAELCSSLAEAMLDESGRIIVATELEPVELGLARAVQVGFIVTELVTNSVKYAFPPPARGQITIGLHCADDVNVRLTVADDGCGRATDGRFPVEGFGLRIVHMLAQQLGGSLTISGGPGITAELTFPRHRQPEKAAA
jgi:PAS domain S-box-containing protein